MMINILVMETWWLTN